MGRARTTILGATVGLLIAAAPAAASSFVIPSVTDNLQPPAVAVDPTGNGWVAWLDSSAPAGTYRVATCEIPAGSTACANPQIVSSPIAGQGAHPFLFIDATGVANLVLAAHNGAGGDQERYSWNAVSMSWTQSANHQIGDVEPSAAAFDPGIGNGVVFGAVNLAAPAMAANSAAFGVSAPYHDVTFVPGGASGPTQVTAAVSDTAAAISVVHAWNSGTSSSSSAGTSYAFYSGPPLKGLPAAGVLTNTSAAGNWTVGTLSDHGSNISLAGGPAGVALAESLTPGGTVLRRFTAGSAGFSPPVSSDCGETASYGAGLQSQALFEDPSTGLLHLAYIESTGSREDVRYTAISGATQSPPQTLGTAAGSALLIDPEVASDGAGHPGLAIWELNAGASHYQLQASWLPTAPLTGCPSAGGGPPPPVGPLPPAGPPSPASLPPQTASISVGDEKLTLSTPSLKSCLPAKALSAMLTAKTTAKTGKSAFKLTSVQVSLDKGIAHMHKRRLGKGNRKHTTIVISYTPDRTIRHLPATVTLSLTRLKPGKHTLTVKATYRRSVRRHGRKLTLIRTGTIKLGLRIC